MKVAKIIQVMFLVMCSGLAIAGSTNVFLGQNICAENNSICVKGSLEYNYSRGKLVFHGRVKNSSKPGIFTIQVQGISEDNEFYSAYLRTKLNGKYSEIVNIESGSVIKHRRDIEWTISRVSYGF